MSSIHLIKTTNNKIHNDIIIISKDEYINFLSLCFNKYVSYDIINIIIEYLQSTFNPNNFYKDLHTSKYVYNGWDFSNKFNFSHQNINMFNIIYHSNICRNPCYNELYKIRMIHLTMVFKPNTYIWSHNICLSFPLLDINYICSLNNITEFNNYITLLYMKSNCNINIYTTCSYKMYLLWNIWNLFFLKTVKFFNNI